MSQHTTRPSSHATSDEEDVTTPQPRPTERDPRGRQRRPAGQPLDGGHVGPDDPDEESEFELIGDDDLGPADLGPAAPNTRDPDADSGRVRKITR